MSTLRPTATACGSGDCPWGRWLRLGTMATLLGVAAVASCRRDVPDQGATTVPPSQQRVTADAPATRPDPPDDQPGTTAPLTIAVANVRAGKGYVMLSLFDSKEGFDEKCNPVCQVRLRSQGDRCKWTLHGIPLGSYAVAVFQDLDDDGVLDRNSLGVPTEPYGFSNNAGSMLGPPAFEEAEFTLAGPGVALEIRLP